MSAPSRPADWPGAQAWVPAEPTTASIARAAQECRGCDLFRDTTQAVVGTGPSSGLALVGEQPGEREDVEGEPFVGPAGRLLDEALTAAGIAPGTVFRTNAVKHFRHVERAGKRLHKSPARWHVAKCEPWLLAELEVVRPAGVVLLGATAGQAAYGSSYRVSASRGRELPWPEHWPSGNGRFVVGTTHPAAVLRSRQRAADLEGLVEDLQLAARLLSSG